MNMVRTNFGFNNSCSFPSASFPKYSSYFRPKTPFCNISGRWYFRVPYCVFIKTAAGPYFLQWQRNFYMQRAKRERWEKREKEGQKEGKEKEKRKRKRGKAKRERRKRAEKRRAERQERERKTKKEGKQSGKEEKSGKKKGRKKGKGKKNKKRGKAKRERGKEREKEEKETQRAKWKKAVSSPQPCPRRRVFPLQKSRNPRFRL